MRKHFKHEEDTKQKIKLQSFTRINYEHVDKNTKPLKKRKKISFCHWCVAINLLLQVKVQHIRETDFHHPCLSSLRQRHTNYHPANFNQASQKSIGQYWFDKLDCDRDVFLMRFDAQSVH